MTISNRLTFKAVLLAATILASPLILAAPNPAAAQAEIALSVQVAPPMLPIYAQPPIPEAGYIWTPGYWHWSQRAGYYWVPGTWVLPPQAGLLWTPPYWGWAGGAYLFHAGYWGPNVGYYGGVNYGYGYGGSGYQGGHWEGSNFAYNRAVNNFGRVPIAHAYQQSVTSPGNSRVSFAGGTHGLKAEPTAAEHSAEHDSHTPVTAQQATHIDAAAKTPVLAASRNHGLPAIAATSHPAQFKGQGVVPARPVAAAQRAAPRTAPPRQAAAPPPRQTEAAPARGAPPHQAATNDKSDREDRR
jgi:hypothetical protein